MNFFLLQKVPFFEALKKFRDYLNSNGHYRYNDLLPGPKPLFSEWPQNGLKIISY